MINKLSYKIPVNNLNMGILTTSNQVYTFKKMYCIQLETFFTVKWNNISIIQYSAVDLGEYCTQEFKQTKVILTLPELTVVRPLDNNNTQLIMVGENRAALIDKDCYSPARYVHWVLPFLP